MEVRWWAEDLKEIGQMWACENTLASALGFHIKMSWVKSRNRSVGVKHVPFVYDQQMWPIRPQSQWRWGRWSRIFMLNIQRCLCSSAQHIDEIGHEKVVQSVKNFHVLLFDFAHLSPGLFLGEIYRGFRRIPFLLYVLITNIHFFVILSL